MKTFRTIKRRLILLMVLPFMIVAMLFACLHVWHSIDFGNCYHNEVEKNERWKNVPEYDYEGEKVRIEQTFEDFKSKSALFRLYLRHPRAYVFASLVCDVVLLSVIMFLLLVYESLKREIYKLCKRPKKRITQDPADIILNRADALDLSTNARKKIGILEMFKEFLD